MAERSAIEWTDRTWNPVVGCTEVSPGCAHCYAATLHNRRHRAYLAGKLQNLPQYAHAFERVQLMRDRVLEPVAWRRPARVFVNSVSDLFHEAVPDDYLEQIWMTMALCPQHVFQILTKRAERMVDFVSRRIALPNVWLGVSIESQRFDYRAALLCQIEATVRFISAEPLLGPLHLWRVNPYAGPHERRQAETHPAFVGLNVLAHPHRPPESFTPRERMGRIDWVIVGGESGPGARPMRIEWARTIVEDCRHEGVAVFVKQLGGARDKRGDPAGWPDDLRVREWPRVEASP